MAVSGMSHGQTGKPIVFTRAALLSLYASPLVPNKLEGMKELSEWYGEYTTPPSPPVQRSQLPARQSSSHAVPQSSASGNSRRLTPFVSDSNPFANFGRFGVDGGLIGEPLEMPRRRGGRNAISAAGAGAGGGEAAPDGKDLAPHLQSTGKKGNRERDDGALPPWAEGTTTSKRDTFFKEERNTRSTLNRNGNLTGANSETRRRGDRTEVSTIERKDRRGLGPADEGGWRSVGTTREEREKRLLRNQATSATDSPRRFDRDRQGNTNNDRVDREREPYSRGNGGGRGGPAWMNDDDAGSSPSWMDGPANGNTSLSKENASATREDRTRGDAELESVTPTKNKDTDWTAGSGAGGIDSIQQWKLQMKEMERKERERDLQDAGIEVAPTPQASVFSDLTSPKPEPASAPKSIFEDLGIVRSPAPAAASAPPPGLDVGQPQQRSSEPAGRASRFAKFFDGKPQSPVAQAAQPPPSVFGALMGANPATTKAGGNGPSKEDTESMTRLMGMLQAQGTRTSSPATPQPPMLPQTIAFPPVPAPSAPQHDIAESQSKPGESRSSSRFKFSNSAARSASPSVSTRSVPPSQPPSAMQSPTTPSQQAPPPPPPGFAGYPSQQQVQASLNHPTPGQLPADGLRSPPLPVPRAMQPQNSQHARTISSTSEGPSRPSTTASNHPSGVTSPLPQPRGPNPAQQQHHLNGGIAFAPPPPQFFANNNNTPSNGQRMPPPMPQGMSHLGMFPQQPPHGQMPPHHPMMSPDMFRNLPPPGVGGGMRSPPLAAGPPGMNGMGFPPPPPPPHGMLPSPQAGTRNPQQQPQMMFSPPPPPSGQYPQGSRSGMPPGVSMGGNAGADLMALLNSGNGAMRIGGPGPSPSHLPQQQQQGNLPPFLMDAR
ncbi:uncharacterized protein JCM15063_001127 [Sporobolomyces koalae]|uniref:uncharacterized protein n=1 Tax=Sporobolomyces koalae TaxID=500713 RepID=UPI003180B5A3